MIFLKRRTLAIVTLVACAGVVLSTRYLHILDHTTRSVSLFPHVSAVSATDIVIADTSESVELYRTGTRWFCRSHSGSDTTATPADSAAVVMFLDNIASLTSKSAQPGSPISLGTTNATSAKTIRISSVKGDDLATLLIAPTAILADSVIIRPAGSQVSYRVPAALCVWFTARYDRWIHRE